MTKVYANNRSIACKAASGQSAAAFPDACFTPPETPATPPGVPIPYPNTVSAGDLTDGSKSVKIGHEEIALKDQSSFKSSVGDEAGNAPKKGLVTSTNEGQANFISWSMNVKVEGENVPRDMDLTGHNESSKPINTPPWTYLDDRTLKVPTTHVCAKHINKAKKKCPPVKPFKSSGMKPRKCSEECKQAMKCLLVPKGRDKQMCCKGESTGHHLIEDHWVNGLPHDFLMAQRMKGYNGYDAAPTVCANRFRKPGTLHRKLHDVQGVFEESHMPGGANYDSSTVSGGWNYGRGRNAALTAHAEVFKTSKCDRKCMKSQLDNFYGAGADDRSLNEPDTQGVGDDQRTLLNKKFALINPVRRNIS